MRNLLILSSNTGEGHNSAATAISAAAASLDLHASIRRPLEESGMMNRMLGGIYNILLTRKPEWMTRYLRLVDGARPNERDIIYRSLRRFIDQFLRSEHPDVLLSVHPMLNHFIPRFIKEERLGIPCCTLLTDPFPPFWKGWASPFVDRYFVVRNEAALALTAMGVDAGKIECVPMPVRPQFRPATSAEREEFRQDLDLPHAHTVLINGGARGGGPIQVIYETVQQAANDVNIVVVCGRNQNLRAAIEKTRDARTRTFGFVTDIHRFIASADLVLTKPGAMSTYEALACRVPVLLLGILALMPQESGMFNAVTRYDFGYSASTYEELERVIRLGPEDWNRKRAMHLEFFQTGSGRELIERIQPLHAPA